MYSIEKVLVICKMEKDQTGTPKASRNKRVRNVETPDFIKKNISDVPSANIRLVASRRASVAHTDFPQPQLLAARRKLPSSRQSILPLQSFIEPQKKPDTESKDTELKLVYDEYLETVMSDIIINKKSKDCLNTNITNLAALSKESDQLEEKLFKVTTREKDIENLIVQQNKIDSEIIEVDKVYKDYAHETIKKILLELQTALGPLDVLCCNDVILPETSEDWEEARRALKECTTRLKCITEVIGTKGKTYESFLNTLQDFTTKFNNIEDSQKMFEKVLCDLQTLILKDASFFLAQSEVHQM